MQRIEQYLTKLDLKESHSMNIEFIRKYRKKYSFMHNPFGSEKDKSTFEIGERKLPASTE